jgi:hypothetical protein
MNKNGMITMIMIKNFLLFLERMVLGFTCQKYRGKRGSSNILKGFLKINKKCVSCNKKFYHLLMTCFQKHMFNIFAISVDSKNSSLQQCEGSLGE